MNPGTPMIHSRRFNRAALAAALALLPLAACAGPAEDEELARASAGSTAASLVPSDTAVTAIRSSDAARGSAVGDSAQLDAAAAQDSTRGVGSPPAATGGVALPAAGPATVATQGRTDAAAARPAPANVQVRKDAGETMDTARRAPAVASRPAASGTPQAATSAAATPADSATRAPTTRAVASAPPAAPPAAAPRPASSAAAPRRPLPFAAGERLEYDVRYGPFRVGRAVLALGPVERLRDRPVFHASFTLRGGNALIRVNDSYESWFDTLTLASLRYVQDIDQGPYERDRHWDIFPERQTLQERGKQEEPSVALPLDDASFIYFVRTLPLAPGQTYEFTRYFRPDRNPVKVVVLRRERIKVPAGTFDAVVVRPIIRSKGLFGEDGHAEVWFSDDASRRVLQIKSKLGVGTVSMQLR